MATSDRHNGDEHDMVVSFLTIRKAVGILGIALPFVLALGIFLISNCHPVRASISSYYYTIMGTYFTGTLCAVGLFLFTYKGYDIQDLIFSKIAGIFAVVTAVFPTNCDHQLNSCNLICTPDSKLSNTLHYISAGIFLTSLAYMALFLFRKSNQPKPYPKPKRTRNLVYLICGCIMVVCLLGIVMLQIPDVDSVLCRYNPEFWFESATLISFGLAWLVKGEMIFKD